MAAFRLKWNSLLRLSELEFTPQAPTILNLTDELDQSISWLTAATREDRRLLRCDSNGALLVNGGWNLFNSVEVAELYPSHLSPETYTPTVKNKGVLVATGTLVVKVGFLRVQGGVTEWVYIPAQTLYWYPNSVYSVIVHCVPDPGGDASYVGVTAFN